MRDSTGMLPFANCSLPNNYDGQNVSSTLDSPLNSINHLPKGLKFIHQNINGLKTKEEYTLGKTILALGIFSKRRSYLVAEFLGIIK